MGKGSIFFHELLIILIFLVQQNYFKKHVQHDLNNIKRIFLNCNKIEPMMENLLKEPKAYVVSMTCFEKVPLDEKLFNIPTINIHCQNRTYDEECHEAVPMLRFIYNNYDNISGKLFFIHGHEFAWHYKKSIYTVVNDKIKEKGFDKIQFAALYNTCWHNKAPWVYHEGIRYLFNAVFYNTSMMKYYNMARVSFPCCSTFVVDAEGFKRRPRYEYKLYIERLMNYSYFHVNPSHLCGRLIEYIWALLLGDMSHVPRANVP